MLAPRARPDLGSCSEEWVWEVREGAWIQCRAWVLCWDYASWCWVDSSLRGRSYRAVLQHIFRGNDPPRPSGPHWIPLRQIPDGVARHADGSPLHAPFREAQITQKVSHAQPAKGMTAPVRALRPASGPRRTAHAGSLGCCCTAVRTSAVGSGSRGCGCARVVWEQGSRPVHSSPWFSCRIGCAFEAVLRLEDSARHRQGDALLGIESMPSSVATPVPKNRGPARTTTPCHGPLSAFHKRRGQCQHPWNG